MQYIAHIRKSDKQIQSVEEHLLEVRKLAERYGEKLGIKHLTGLAGMLHDLGKYTNEFREYILEAVNNQDSSPRRGSVDHSTAGGKLLFELFHKQDESLPYQQLLSEIVGNAIISHHSYLQDFLNPNLESKYLNRVRDKELDEFDVSKQMFFEKVIGKRDFYNYVNRASNELEKFITRDNSKTLEEKAMFLSKFIFSSLIDGDRTNTRLFEERKLEESNRDKALFDIYYERLIAKIHSYKKQPNAKTEINKLRAEMSEQCDKYAEKSSGIYTLSVPTGGGKTLASLRYALKHARLFKKERIIYVVPYTTIIEQNAQQVRQILKDDINILEHHSNVIEDTNDNDENKDGFVDIKQRLKLAKDNWDSPIIFTTMVQFLNVFYAKGSRNIRRLHNLSQSIIIFDEVQKVPVPCVSLFNQALNFLKTNCHSSIVLCTATQPALDIVEHKLEINSDGEIINNLDHVIESFKRVEIIDRASNEIFNNEKLVDFIDEKLEEVSNVLVILNTKSVVKDLYQRLKEKESSISIYHLSTSMCSAHRNKILGKIRHCLDNREKVICISTQLIEAGVDISFECVIRSLAGLDSIAQAAGRCNRHGENELQNVYVIDHEEENLSHLKEIRIGKQVSKRIFIDIHKNRTHHGGHILSRQAMESYFKEYFTELKTDLNYFIPKIRKEMTELLSIPRPLNSIHTSYQYNKGKSLPIYLVNSYYTAAEHFRVVDDRTTSVIVPFEEGKNIIADLNGAESIDDLTRLLRKAQQYTINIYQYEKDQLGKNNGLISYLDEKIFVLTEGAYNEEFGLDFENESGLGLSLF